MKQTLFAPLPDSPEAVKVVTTPAVPVQLAGLSTRTLLDYSVLASSSNPSDQALLRQVGLMGLPLPHCSAFTSSDNLSQIRYFQGLIKQVQKALVEVGENKNVLTCRTSDILLESLKNTISGYEQNIVQLKSVNRA